MRENVKILLLKYHLTYAWLINELDKRGLLVSNTELSDILNGRRRGGKAVEVINMAVEVLNKYVKCYEEG